MADPGFPRGGGANWGGGNNTRQIFLKTAWNWRNLDARGVPRAPLRSANAWVLKQPQTHSITNYQDNKPWSNDIILTVLIILGREKILFVFTLDFSCVLIFLRHPVHVHYFTILKYKQQECIPVGFVPPAAISVRRGLHQAPPWDEAPSWDQTPLDQTPPRTRHPPDQAPPKDQTPQTRHPSPRIRHPPGPGTPQEQTPTGTRHPPDQTPSPVDRHTPVNILPCPKFRLRAVKIC